MTASRRPPEVVLCPDGPMLLRGDHVVVDESGQPHRTRRPVSAVCRCGHTATAPWCDGTHKVAVPKSSAARREAADEGETATGRGRHGYHPTMTTTPQEPDPDGEPLQSDDDPGASPIPGEKQTPGADADDPEYEHESPQRIEGGEPT